MKFYEEVELNRRLGKGWLFLGGILGTLWNVVKIAALGICYVGVGAAVLAVLVGFYEIVTYIARSFIGWTLQPHPIMGQLNWPLIIIIILIVTVIVIWLWENEEERCPYCIITTGERYGRHHKGGCPRHRNY